MSREMAILCRIRSAQVSLIKYDVCKCCAVQSFRAGTYLEYLTNLSTDTRIDSYQSHQEQGFRQLRWSQNAIRLKVPLKAVQAPLLPFRSVTPLRRLRFIELKTDRFTHATRSVLYLRWPPYFNEGWTEEFDQEIRNFIQIRNNWNRTSSCECVPEIFEIKPFIYDGIKIWIEFGTHSYNELVNSTNKDMRFHFINTLPSLSGISSQEIPAILGGYLI